MTNPTQEIETLANTRGGLSSLEIEKTRKCNGTYIDEIEGEEKSAEFEYKQYPGSAVGVLRKQKYEDDEREKLAEKYNTLGLKDITFNCLSRDESFKENLKGKHVYVLMHGWTASNDIYSEVHMGGGLSVAEQIMAMDPDAIIITPDGNGFGGSVFRENILKGDGFNEYCTAEAYAKQMDFLIRDVLGLDPAEITIAGHSMGGAATYEMIGLGYKNGVAIAPAAFPSRESLDETKEKVQGEEGNRVKTTLEKYGINLSAIIYDVIGGSVKLGEGVMKLNTTLTNKMAEATVREIFELITPHLMGKEITGIPKVDKRMIEELVRIHAKEVIPKKYAVVSGSIKVLGNGTNYSKWNEEKLGNVARVEAFSGTTDVLVQPRDFEANGVVLAIKAIDTPHERPVAEVVAKNQEDSHKINGGHYAGVYHPAVIAAIVKKGKELPLAA